MCPPTAQRNRGALLRLQAEYIHAVVQDGAVLSLPLASSASSSIEDSICFDCQRKLRGPGAEALPHINDTFFTVVDQWPYRKKAVIWHQDESLCIPASLGDSGNAKPWPAQSSRPTRCRRELGLGWRGHAHSHVAGRVGHEWMGARMPACRPHHGGGENIQCCGSHHEARLSPLFTRP